MKNKQILKEYREKDEKALAKELQDLYKKISDLEFKLSFRRLKNPHEITQTKKQIAQVWTLMHEKAAAKLEKEVK